MAQITELKTETLQKSKMYNLMKDKTNKSKECCEKCWEAGNDSNCKIYYWCDNPACPCHEVKREEDMTPETRAKIEKGVEDFANRFEGVMKELAEEDTQESWEAIKKEYSQSGLFDNIYDEEELDKRVKYLLAKEREATIKEVIEKIEGMKKEIFELKYEPLFKKDYKMEAHEQTLRIGYNQALQDVKTLLTKE